MLFMEEQSQKKETSDSKVSKIRTFKDDLANAVRSGGVTTAKIAIKEQQRRRALGIDSLGDKKKSPKIIIAIVSFVFLFLALGIFAVLTLNPSLSFLNSKDTEEAEQTIEPLFENVSQVEISTIAGKNTIFNLFDNLLDNKEPGELKSFEFYKKNIDGLGEQVTPDEFFRYIQARPDRLDRSIEKIIYGLDGENPFILMEIRSFETTFAGMIKWEETMTRDLEPVFHKIREINIETEIPNPEYVETDENEVEESEEKTLDPNEEVETTEEETVEIPKTIIEITQENWRGAKYYDEILFNKDARVLRKDTGEQGIIYTFIDENYVLISTEVSTIKTILEKVSEYYIANY